MNAPADLFPELLPANYDSIEEARELALCFVQHWFGTLSYRHSQETHDLILESLEWDGIEDFVRDASLHYQDAPIDFQSFAAGIRYQARKAQEAGLVVPDGKWRKRARAGDATGDLFGGDDESGVSA